VRYLTLWWRSEVLEYKPICPAFITATGRGHWGWTEHSQSSKGVSAASRQWWGSPWLRKYQFSIESGCDYDQHQIRIQVSWWGLKSADPPCDLHINRQSCSSPQVFNSRSAWIPLSGESGLGHMVYCVKVGLGLWYARSDGGRWNGSSLVLTMGPGNLPAVRVWPTKMGQFGSRPGEKPDPMTHAGPNPDTYPSTRRFHWVWLDPSVPISSSTFWISHLWWHSDKLLLFGNYWQWYITVHFRCIGRLHD